MALVTTHFPNLTIDELRLSIWRESLVDLSDEQFAEGVRKFCLEHTEIYPGTNIIAHIRNYGLGVKKRDLKADATLAFALIRARRKLPEFIEEDAASQAWDMAMRSSTGLTSDAMWDERRFVDLYVSLAGEGDQ